MTAVAATERAFGSKDFCDRSADFGGRSEKMDNAQQLQNGA